MAADDASPLSRVLLSVIQWFFEMTAECLGSEWTVVAWCGYALAALLIASILVALLIVSVVRLVSPAPPLTGNDAGVS